MVVGLAAGTGGAVAAGSGSATGTIVSTGHTPLAGMCVNVVNASSNVTVGTSAATTANGIWQLSGIPSSTAVIAYAFDCSGGNYVGVWWGNTPFQSDAKQFTVGTGKTRAGINFNLKLGGAVTGKVTDAATKKPVADILVIPLSLIHIYQMVLADSRRLSRIRRYSGVQAESNAFRVRDHYPLWFSFPD